MKKTEFIEEMRAYARNYGEVIIEEINKTNCTYLGLAIRKNNVPTPVVNLDKLYEAYKAEELNINECFEEVERILSMKQPFNPSVITEWNTAKERLYLRLFGSIAPDTIYRKVADMFLVPYLQIEELDGATVRVTPQLLDVWGITEEEIFELARANQEKIRPATITNMAELLGVKDKAPLYVISTETGVCGASAILYKGMADKIRDKIGGDFYILPSSIHEVIAVPKALGNSVDDLVHLVSTVNSADVDEEDRLTETVYMFNEDDELVPAI